MAPTTDFPNAALGRLLPRDAVPEADLHTSPQKTNTRGTVRGGKRKFISKKYLLTRESEQSRLRNGSRPCVKTLTFECASDWEAVCAMDDSVGKSGGLPYARPVVLTNERYVAITSSIVPLIVAVFSPPFLFTLLVIGDQTNGMNHASPLVMWGGAAIIWAAALPVYRLAKAKRKPESDRIVTIRFGLGDIQIEGCREIRKYAWCEIARARKVIMNPGARRQITGVQIQLKGGFYPPDDVTDTVVPEQFGLKDDDFISMVRAGIF